MIEVVAIDNRGAEAELLRLAADFAESRLFTPKQKKRFRFVVEVTGTAAPMPIAREQLAQKPGLFKAAQHHLTAMISLAHGFDSATLQLMHELIHVSQVVNNRYVISAKTQKLSGVKQRSYQAKWLGKKAGFIDQTDWQDRPWEQEAATIGEQLSAEFTAFIYGAQNSFAAQGHEKGAGKMLRLYELAIALPIAPPAPAPIAPPNLDVPNLEAPSFDQPVGDESLAAATLPSFDAAPFGALDAEKGGAETPDADQGEQSDDILADIDALLSADAMASEPSAPEMPEGEMPESLIAEAPLGEKQTYVLGIAEPRSLKLSVLEAKRQELAERGLLEV